MSLKSSKKIETNVYQLEIAVDGDTFQDAINKAYQKVKKQVSVPGFRKGKATRGMIEKFYGEEVFYNDAFEIIYPDAVESAVKEAGLELVDSPFDVDVPEISKDGLVFVLKATVKPEIEIGKYKGLKIEKQSTEVTDEEVEAQISNMLERSARFIEVDRKVESGDLVTLDFEGFTDGEAFEGGKAEGYELNIGSGTFIPGFEDQIIGHKAGEEFDIQVKFPEEYGAENLAGKDATFKIKIHVVKEKELPALDDDFAKDVSEFDTLAELREDTKNHLAEHKVEDAEAGVEEEILTQLADLVSGEIPEVMYERQTDNAVNEFGYQIQSQGMDLDMYLAYTGLTAEGLRDTFKTRSVKQVKCNLALEKIAELEKIEISDEDIEEQYSKLAEQYGMEADVVKKAILRDDVAKELKSSKALDVVKTAAKITEAKPEAKKSTAKKSTSAKSSETKKSSKTQTADTAGEKKSETKKTTAKKSTSASKTSTAKKTTKKAADDTAESK